MIAEFQLSDGERSHPLWIRLKAHLEERLAAARLSNDKLQPEMDTAALRGEIACLKKLIALGKERPVIND